MVLVVKFISFLRGFLSTVFISTHFVDFRITVITEDEGVNSKPV